MRQNGIQGAKRRGKPWRTTKADPAALRSPDRVQRDFTASRPDEMWFADFTYLRCWEGLVFFSFVIDAYSRMIVGWQFANHMRTDLVLDALGWPCISAPREQTSRSCTLRRRQPIHVIRLHTTPRRPRRARLDRISGRRLRQRGRRELRRHLQDRADHRPQLGDTLAARARHRRVRRLVQQRASTRKTRRPATPRDRGTLRCENQANERDSLKIGNLQTPSPRNPGRLRPIGGHAPRVFGHTDNPSDPGAGGSRPGP